MAGRANRYATDVFLDCPFDDAYFDCGFRPRCTLEVEDSGEVRIDKILRTIEQCRFGVHDLSRTELDGSTRLPRFNMPLELGLFLAAKRFGDRRQRLERCLILDGERYRYQKFISDIAGQDIRSHRNSPAEAIRVVRDWLDNHSSRKTIPDQPTYKDYCGIVARWLRSPPGLDLLPPTPP